MAEAQASLVSQVAVYPGRHSRIPRSQKRSNGARRNREPQGLGTDDDERKAEREAASGSEGRRAYNREYMRQWRKRNQERYRVYNREYQRKRHIERKIARILNAPAETRNLCGYGCGRPAVQTIERIDPRTWKTVQMPYCGHC